MRDKHTTWTNSLFMRYFAASGFSVVHRTIVMRQRLAEVQARIVSDPFLAARFGGAGAAEDALGPGQGRNAMMDLRDTIVQLATAQVGLWKQVNMSVSARKHGRGSLVFMGYFHLIVDIYEFVCGSQDVNAELERRLATERNISRSWQANLRALQREVRVIAIYVCAGRQYLQHLRPL